MLIVLLRLVVATKFPTPLVKIDLDSLELLAVVIRFCASLTPLKGLGRFLLLTTVVMMAPSVLSVHLLRDAIVSSTKLHRVVMQMANVQVEPVTPSVEW